MAMDSLMEERKRLMMMVIRDILQQIPSRIIQTNSMKLMLDLEQVTNSFQTSSIKRSTAQLLQLTST
jgi:hypothetical protein